MEPVLRVVTVPSADRAFRVHVDAAVDELGTRDPAAIEARLREAYPSAVVTTSSDLGSLVEGDVRLYAYRDRHAARRPLPGDWWRDESLPRTVVDADGRYADANDAAAELFGVSRSNIIGARAGSFTRHESSDGVGKRLFEAVLRYGEIASTAVVQRSDGTLIDIEFHTRRLAEGTEYLTVMRVRSLDPAAEREPAAAT